MPDQEPTPKVIVKFQPAPPVDSLDTTTEKATASQANATKILAQFPELKMRPLFPAASTEALDTLPDSAPGAKRVLLPTENLSAFYEVEIVEDQQTGEIIGLLREQPEVEYVYERLAPAPPPDYNPEDDPKAHEQGYLAAAPAGINLAFAQTFAGGDGRGVNFIDIEQGWTLNHEDLVESQVTLKWGKNKAYFGHGTAVLGQVVAADNTKGIIGIARGCRTMVISQWENARTHSTERAIIKAVELLNPGDVLLIEAQVAVPSRSENFFPVEIEPLTHAALRIAFEKGIIVIEAAGNGFNDLDQYQDPVEGFILDRQSPDFKDSGAIMVGAASADASHQRLDFSNHGSRIDCFGWGGGIVTTGDGYSGREIDAYTDTFAGTSGASPIIAGVAIIVQAIQQALEGQRLTPEEMRAFLSDPQNGTSSAHPPTDRIGCMPDLEKLLTNLFIPA